MQQLGGNRISETISDELLDTDARMSDMSNLTLGNQVAQLNVASPLNAIRKSPFQQREVSDSIFPMSSICCFYSMNRKSRWQL